MKPLEISDNILKASLQNQNQSHTHQHQQPKIVQNLASNGNGKEVGLASPKLHAEVSRNDPCPCGSTKKWKKCGMINSQEHQLNISKNK